MENSKEQKTKWAIKSMIKYTITNPSFSLLDKIEFFAFYTFTLLLLFGGFYFLFFTNVINVHTNLSTSLVLLVFALLFILLLKYSRKFHRKFSVPYFESIGDTEMVAKYESGMGFAEEWAPSYSKTLLKLFILEGVLFVSLVVVLMLTIRTKYFGPVFLGFYAIAIFLIIRLLFKWQQKTADLVLKYNPEGSFTGKLAQWQKRKGIFIDIILGVVAFLLFFWFYSVWGNF